MIAIIIDELIQAKLDNAVNNAKQMLDIGIVSNVLISYLYFNNTENATITKLAIVSSGIDGLQVTWTNSIALNWHDLKLSKL